MDLSRLSADDLMALRAGELGRVSTAGLHELKRQQLGSDPQAQRSARAAATAEPVDNTMGMGRGALALAGVGKAVSDLFGSIQQGASWLGNKAGLVSNAAHGKLQADLDEQARIDRRLMDNGSAIAGNVAGQLAISFLPGMGAARSADALWKAGGAANIARSLGTAGALGAAQNAVMNPRTGEDGLLGQAASGGLLGAGGQLLAPALSAVVQGGRHLLSGQQGQAGRAIGTAASAGRTPDAAALRALAETIRRNATEIVPGSLPTGVQTAGNDGISQLARSVGNRVQGGALAGRAADQNAARMAHLGQVAPIQGTSIEAAENAGRLVADEAGAWRDMLKGATRDKYNEAMDAGVSLALPASQDAARALKTFYPRGPVPGDPHAATLHAFAAQLDDAAPVPLAEFDALRKQAGNKARALARGVGDSDPTAASAWGALKELFDRQETAALKAGAMTPEQAAPLAAGRALHVEGKARFGTGPAALLQRTGADGAPRLEGAEVAKNFFGSGAAQAQAVESLNRIVLERGPGKQAMRSYAITDLVQSATNKADELGLHRYERWVEQRSEALKGLLTDEQLGKVKSVLMDLKRADKSTNAGRATGSNTAQNLAGDGLLGGMLLDALASKVPYAGPWVAGGMREAQRNRTAGLLDAVLADPTRTAGALDTYAGLLDPNGLQRGLAYTPNVMNPLAGGLLESLRSQPRN